MSDTQLLGIILLAAVAAFCFSMLYIGNRRLRRSIRRMESTLNRYGY